MIVLDASAVVSRSLPDQSTLAAVNFFASVYQNFLAPRIFLREFPNALPRYERNGAITPLEADKASAVWLSIVEFHDSLLALALASLAPSERLTLFDAADLQLTESVNLARASRDKALLEAAQRRGISIHDLRQSP